MKNEITVVVTVYNERDNIEALISSLLNQSKEPYELIITDGGSTDGTWELLCNLQERYPKLKAISMPGNRSKGRNTAINAAKTEYIAVTDAGTVADKDWLLYLYNALESGAYAVAGFYQPLVKTKWEKIIANMTIPSLKTVNPKRFLPSSRSVAFRKTAFIKAGGYPEEFSHNEDTPFDLALINVGYRFVFVPEALVYWRPRKNLSDVYKQFYHYALGDGEARIQYRDYLLIFLRYLLPFFYPYGFYFGALLWIARFFKDLYKTKSLYFIPVRFVIDIADMLGFIKGRKEAWVRWIKANNS